MKMKDVWYTYMLVITQTILYTVWIKLEHEIERYKHLDIKANAALFYWKTGLIFTPRKFLLLFFIPFFKITISFLIRARDPSLSSRLLCSRFKNP